MKYLSKIPEIENIANLNNGLIKYADLAELKIKHYAIQQLIHRDILEKIRGGTYRLASQSANLSEIELLGQVYPNGILCMESALFHYHYIDLKPECWHLAIDKNTSRSLFLKTVLRIEPHFMDGRFLNIGKESVFIDGFSINIYSRDRLICECIKHQNKFKPELFYRIIRRYRDDKKSNIGKLAYFAYLRNIHAKFSRLFDFHGFDI